MTTTLPRRRFLQLLGLGATAGAGLVVAEPARRIWQVSAAAPVAWRGEAFDDGPLVGPLVIGSRTVPLFDVRSGSQIALMHEAGTARARLYADARHELERRMRAEIERQLKELFPESVVFEWRHNG